MLADTDMFYLIIKLSKKSCLFMTNGIGSGFNFSSNKQFLVFSSIISNIRFIIFIIMALDHYGGFAALSLFELFHSCTLQSEKPFILALGVSSN